MRGDKVEDGLESLLGDAKAWQEQFFSLCGCFFKLIHHIEVLSVMNITPKRPNHTVEVLILERCLFNP